jgi:hypothetical protein
MRAGALCPRAPNLTCRWPRPAWSTMESTSSTGRPSRNSSRSTRAVATGNARPPLSAVSPAAQRTSHLIVIVRSRILPLAHACRKQTVLFALSLASVGFSCYLLYERARTACPRQAALGVLLAPSGSFARVAMLATEPIALRLRGNIVHSAVGHFGRTRHRSSPRMDRKFRLSDAFQSCTRRRQYCLSKQSRSACAEVHFERLLHRMHYVPLHQLQHGNMPPRLPAAFGACRLRRRKPCAAGLQFYFCYKEYFSTSKVTSGKLQ